MNFKAKLILLCLILILFNVGTVSAHDNNLTNESWEVETQDNILRLNSDFKQNEMIQLDNGKYIRAVWRQYTIVHNLCMVLNIRS